MLFEAILILSLLIFSALTSLSETVLTSVSRVKVKRFHEQKLRGAKALFSLREHPHQMLTAILIANNVTNIVLSSLTTILTLQFLERTGWHPFEGLIIGISTGLLTFIVLVFGEVTPKAFAIQHADRLSLRVAPFIQFLVALLLPATELITKLSYFFIRVFGGAKQERSPFMTAEDLKIMVSVSKEEGILEAQEEHMIHSIMEFGDKKVTEAMTPRTEMICIKSNESIHAAIDLIIKEGHSRIPVYEENIDNIIGVVYAKDLLKIQRSHSNLTVKDCMRPPLFIPEGKMVDELLLQMQSAKTHVAIIVDEYGGTVGLITFEDVIEEIVGETADEYEVEEETAAIRYDGENTLVIPADMGIDEVNDFLKVQLPKEEYTTIGGFVFGLFGRLPNRGESITYENLILQIQEVGKRRIKKIRLTHYPEGIEKHHDKR